MLPNGCQLPSAAPAPPEGPPPDLSGAEPAVEETTTVEVYGFHKDWLNPLY